jgi:hypothetical protein
MDKVNTITGEEGTIKVFVCSRGCYQYLLEYNSKYYYPGELPEKFKEDGLEVIFSGIFKDTETAINKPAPNDKPVFDFNAQDIELSSIEEK